MSQEVQVSAEGDVTTILLNRPEAGNRLTNAMAGAVEAGIRQAKGSRVILLRGAGADFCAGRDMQPPAPGSGVKPADVLRDDAGPMLSLFEAWRNCRAPIIGVVQGKAWGIGTVFAGLCDVTLAADSSTFRLGELERGIPPCIAMAPLLDRMPKKALAYLVLSAEEMGADAAQAHGIVSRVLPAAQLEAAVQALVKRLLGFSQASVEAVKLYLDTAPHFNDASAVTYGSSLLANVLASR
jgi:enoyl-CoA hydratase/carnithine racemase